MNKRVADAIEEFKNGNILIVIDDEDRENEGDLAFPAIFSTPQKVNFLAKEARGLICTPLTKKYATKFGLHYMVEHNNSSYETAFTVSVDAKSCATGISAFERHDTIKLLSDYETNNDLFVKPGHIFPLIAKDGGLLERTGHTEASVELCKLAGLAPVAVICEIMNDDGTMARRDDLKAFGLKHSLKSVYISELVEYKMELEKK